MCLCQGMGVLCRLLMFFSSPQPRAAGPGSASLSIHEDTWMWKLKGKFMPAGLSCHPPFHPPLPLASNLIWKCVFCNLGINLSVNMVYYNIKKIKVFFWLSNSTLMFAKDVKKKTGKTIFTVMKNIIYQFWIIAWSCIKTIQNSFIVIQVAFMSKDCYMFMV